MFNKKYRTDNEKIQPDAQLKQQIDAQLNSHEAVTTRFSIRVRRKKIITSVVSSAVCLALIVTGTLVYLNNQPGKPPDTSQISIGADYDEIYALASSLKGKFSDAGRDGLNEEIAGAPQAPGNTDTSADKGSYSNTNVQVEGVDEADIIKTDGKNIYWLSNNTLRVLTADGKNTKTIASVDLSQADNNKTLYSSEMYLAGDRLIIIQQNSQGIAADGAEYLYYGFSYGPIYASVYDISDPANPNLIKKVGQSGYYISSRMVDDTLYLVSNYYLNGTFEKDDPSTYIPQIMDGNKSSLVSAEDICITSDPQNNNFIVVSAFNIKGEISKLSSKAIFGSGGTLYANTEHMLIASYGSDEIKSKENGVETVTCQNNTKLILLSLNDGVLQIEGDAKIPGALLNQFSMDEYKGYFRIVTTVYNYSYIVSGGNNEGVRSVTSVPGSTGSGSGAVEPATAAVPATAVPKGSSVPGSGASSGKAVSSGQPEEAAAVAPATGAAAPDSSVSSVSSNGTKNALYVLDSNLKIVGSLTDIAPDERVYSVRFAEELCYFVTYRQVDPLFAVDLANPSSPKILSALKIPGFSNYLHSYKDGLLFGLGMAGDESGFVKGLKLSMFDVSDPKNVTEKFMKELGYHYSAASYNHKAILVSSEKDIIAFPAEDAYLIYGYSDETGFYLKGEIKFGDNWYWDNCRGVYIGDYFYICSATEVKVLSLTDYSVVASKSI